MDDLKPTWVDTAAAVREVAAACRNAGRMALDTEADSLHSYFHKTCLVQVTAAGNHWLVDPLALADGDLAPLWEVVGDPTLPVLMHGADYDLRVLDRDYDARIRGLEDTQIMAQLLGEPKTGLAALLERDVGVVLDKKHQRADWGRRPLRPELCAYAAADTAYLEELAAKLRPRLEQMGRWGWAREEFARLEQVRHTEPEPDPRAFERLKGANSLKGAARDRVFALFEWRDQTARNLDIPPFKVLGNGPLVELARQPVEHPRELPQRQGLGPRFARRWGRDVVRLLRNPAAAPERRRRPRSESPPAAVRRRLERLTTARDEVAARLELPGGLVCPKATLTEVAAAAPTSRRQLEDAGLEGWRLEVLGEPLLTAVKTS